ncbi:hypothetical protein MYAM1_001133 [Malassezia yamatoensis]|uniref:Checkpoint protein n=1 Tax=Malassezia yamatoensis TaxID=253288 RepID=A0AAJ5YTC1_9BASI|nr:hypothetical protein MYAM1_001133 [Malassezia yamatoensis]
MNQAIQGKSLGAKSAHAYLYASIFDEYRFVPPQNWPELANCDESDKEDTQPYICFEINVSTMVQCLALFESRMSTGEKHDQDKKSSESFVELMYRGAGEPMCLALHAGRLHMNFQLRTLDTNLIPELYFAADSTVAQVIMKVGAPLIQSEWLARTFQELDAAGETRVHIRLHQRTSRTAPGHLEFQTENSYGSTEISFPNETQLLEKFECFATVNAAYPLQCISYMLQAIKTSSKTSLRIDQHGMLSIQFMIASHRAHVAPRRVPSLTVASSGNAFVEFLVRPLLY